MKSIKSLQSCDRPIEKLIAHGTSKLSDEELLAILIGSGTKNKNAVFLARELLDEFSSKYELLNITAEELMKFSGIGTTKACRIISGLTLGQRFSKNIQFHQIKLTDPETVAQYFKHIYDGEQREIFCVVLLDTKNRPIRNEIISIGTLNTTLVHPREVFRIAVKASANAIILTHNHPSGDPTPSVEDIEITNRLLECGKLLGINVLDHIIVAKSTYVSLMQEGYIVR